MLSLKQLAARSWVNQNYNSNLAELGTDHLYIDLEQKLQLLKQHSQLNLPDDILGFIWEALVNRRKQNDLLTEIAHSLGLWDVKSYLIHQDEIDLEQTTCAILIEGLVKQGILVYFIEPLVDKALKHGWIKVLIYLSDYGYYNVSALSYISFATAFKDSNLSSKQWLWQQATPEQQQCM